MSPASGAISGGTYVTAHGVGMADTSVDSFVATATLGGQSIGNVYCSRQGAHDASCSFTTPALATLPAGPLDLQITLRHTTGSSIQTSLEDADKFNYTLLPALSSFTFLASASGGQTANANLVLDGYAPTDGAQVSLSLAPGGADVVRLPPTVVVPAGQTSVTVPVLVTNQNFTGDVSIVASYAGTLVSGTLRVYPTPNPKLGAIPSLCAGQTFVETITLVAPAPPGGGVVALSADEPSVSVPASVTVPEGSKTATFEVTAGSPATLTVVHLSADYYGIGAPTIETSVLPATGVRLTLTSSSVQGGSQASGTLDLCSAAPPEGAIVALSSDTALAAPPSTITVPAGSTSTPIAIPTRWTTTAERATITATYQGNSATAGLGITPPPAPLTCGGGQTLCTCSSGAQTCVTSSMQCLLYCSKH